MAQALGRDGRVLRSINLCTEEKMPSCVVKTCKNNSMDVSKLAGGITFHKFPKEVNWKSKWIKIIRECRSEETWIPSKYSVVCSDHFAEGDIYTSKGGNRRITANAVPKEKLCQINKKKKGAPPTKIRTASVSVQTSDETGDGEMITGDRVESSSGRIETIIIKVEPRELTEENSEIEKQSADQIQKVGVKIEPKESEIDPLASQQDLTSGMGLVPYSTYYKAEIKRKNDQLKIYRNKIKILLQKVHRYQRRNLKLKHILKEIKCKKLIDKDIFRELTTGLGKDD